ncbi:hypothetical protein ACVGH1_005118, partial [Escherichia coli]
MKKKAILACQCQCDIRRNVKVRGVDIFLSQPKYAPTQYISGQEHHLLVLFPVGAKTFCRCGAG